MLYVIRKVLDKNGKEKKNPIVKLRVNRVVDLDPFDIISGKPLLLECVLPGFWKSIITSDVEYWVEEADETLRIITKNSEYILGRVYDNS